MKGGEGRRRRAPSAAGMMNERSKRECRDPEMEDGLSITFFLRGFDTFRCVNRGRSLAAHVSRHFFVVSSQLLLLGLVRNKQMCMIHARR